MVLKVFMENDKPRQWRGEASLPAGRQSTFKFETAIPNGCRIFRQLLLSAPNSFLYLIKVETNAIVKITIHNAVMYIRQLFFSPM
jgi:hypothetical protein